MTRCVLGKPSVASVDDRFDGCWIDIERESIPEAPTANGGQRGQPKPITRLMRTEVDEVDHAELVEVVMQDGDGQDVVVPALIALDTDDLCVRADTSASSSFESGSPVTAPRPSSWA